MHERVTIVQVESILDYVEGKYTWIVQVESILDYVEVKYTWVV